MPRCASSPVAFFINILIGHGYTCDRFLLFDYDFVFEKSDQTYEKNSLKVLLVPDKILAVTDIRRK